MTGAQTEGIPPGNSRRFFEIEYTSDDFNRFAELARRRRPIGSLSRATDGDLTRSRRYREVFGPLGIGEDLRVALKSAGACWGYLVLHRSPDHPFTGAEADYVLSLAEHLAEGLRTALFHRVVDGQLNSDGPGVIVLSDDLEVVSATETGRRWVEDLDASGLAQGGLPNAVHSVVSKLRALEDAAIPPGLMPRARVQSRTGRWLVIHASRLGGGSGAGQIAVVLEPARPAEMAPLIMRAYGFTDRESQITQLVAQGCTTREIAAQLHISELTVQEHLKSVFEKMSVNSRREVVARLFSEQYWPRIASGLKPGHDGWFEEAARQPPAS